MKFFKKYQFSTAFEIGNTLFSVHRVEGIKCGTRSCGIRTRSRARAPEPIVSHQGCLRSAFRGAVWLYVYGLYIYTRTHIRVGINTRVNVKVCPVVWAFVRRKRKEMNRKKATTSSQKKRFDWRPSEIFYGFAFGTSLCTSSFHIDLPLLEQFSENRFATRIAFIETMEAPPSSGNCEIIAETLEKLSPHATPTRQHFCAGRGGVFKLLTSSSNTNPQTFVPAPPDLPPSSSPLAINWWRVRKLSSCCRSSASLSPVITPELDVGA